MKKGFTLVELLIVIGILAVLSTATVLILNPGQILAETRDTQRLNDLSTISSALSLYLATVTSPTFAGNWQCTLSPAAAPCLAATGNVLRNVTGTGWVNVNLGATAGGSPIAVLPLDPIGTQTSLLHYSFETDNINKTFEITAQMESARYSNGGTANKELPDGGNNNDCYEVGNDPALDLIGAAEC